MALGLIYQIFSKLLVWLCSGLDPTPVRTSRSWSCATNSQCSSDARHAREPALVADRLRTGSDVLLDDGFTATGTGPRGTVRLRATTVGGVLDLTGSTVESTSVPEHRWLLDGLTYSAVPRLTDRDNRRALQELLRTATPSYAAQPYQQLASAYRSEGHDADARAILMQQRRDQLERGALTDRRDRAWARVTGLLLGYGYRPSRALLYLVGVLTLSVTLTVLLGGHGHSPVHPTNPPPP